jgi:hypothetical protein
MYVYMCVYVFFVCMHIYIHKHTYVHTHTHMQEDTLTEQSRREWHEWLATHNSQVAHIWIGLTVAECCCECHKNVFMLCSYTQQPCSADVYRTDSRWMLLWMSYKCICAMHIHILMYDASLTTSCLTTPHEHNRHTLWPQAVWPLLTSTIATQFDHKLFDHSSQAQLPHNLTTSCLTTHHKHNCHTIWPQAVWPLVTSTIATQFDHKLFDHSSPFIRRAQPILRGLVRERKIAMTL